MLRSGYFLEGRMTMWRHLFACANPDPLQHRRGQLLVGVLLGLLVLASFTLVRGLQEPERPLLVSALLGLGLFIVGGVVSLQSPRGRTGCQLGAAAHGNCDRE